MASSFSNIGSIRTPLSRRLYWGIAALTFIVPALAWWLISLTGAIDPLFLPSPSGVWDTAVRLADNGKLWSDIGWSVSRVLIGFGLAAVIAVPIGILMGTFHVADAIFEPMTDFIRYMPAAAFIPLIMLYVGIGEASKILMIFIGTYFQLVLLVAVVARNVSHDLIKVGYTLGTNRRKTLLHIIVPASLPGLADTLRITLGWAWTYVVVAELIAAQQGLGFRIMEAQRFLQTGTIFLYILIIGLLGLVSDQLIRWLAAKALPWAEELHK
jgi:NitT/TauT family transport system permease protein